MLPPVGLLGQAASHLQQLPQSALRAREGQLRGERESGNNNGLPPPPPTPSLPSTLPLTASSSSVVSNTW